MNDREPLTQAVLRELKDGPATAAELAVTLHNYPWKSVSGTCSNLLTQGRVISVGKRERRGQQGGREEHIFALPGTPMLNAPPRPKVIGGSGVIAGPIVHGRGSKWGAGLV